MLRVLRRGWLRHSKLAVTVRAQLSSSNATRKTDQPDSGWETVVGLEVHARITSRTKLFSEAPVVVDAAPNSAVSLFDAAHPGSLPVLNAECVRQAVRTALALDGKLNMCSRFDRKHYFYHDLPHGYQITQKFAPLMVDGCLEATDSAGARRVFRIQHLQLEIDSGKSVHDVAPDRTLVDLNRAGCALMEIVTAPDMRSAADAGLFVRRLQALLRHIGTCDGNMQDGSFRVDVNVSVRRTADGRTLDGPRVEVKNLNSVRAVERAIESEARRHIAALQRAAGAGAGAGAAGEPLVAETRMYDAAAGCTRRMRTKETQWDYRFFPEPDLPPLRLDPAFVVALRATLPPRPEQLAEQLARSTGIAAREAALIAADPVALRYFTAAAAGRPARRVATWLTVELYGRLHAADRPLEQCPVTPAQLGSLVDALEAGQLTAPAAKTVLQHMLDGDARPAAEVAAAHGLLAASDTSGVRALCERLLAAHPNQMAQYRAGRSQLHGFFVGLAMKETGRRVSPQLIGDTLRALLDGRDPDTNASATATTAPDPTAGADGSR